MSVKLDFYLSDNDMDRLWAIKKEKHKEDLTGNEFARELLESTLHRLHPGKVKDFDEGGNEML